MIANHLATTPKVARYGPRSYEACVASETLEISNSTLMGMNRKDLRAMARRSYCLGEGQTPPDGAWRTWLFLGGRGAGKTFAGARWLTEQATPGACLALVGPTLHDVREVMIDGPSGLVAQAPPGAERPRYEASRRRLLWPNGAMAYCFSAEDPESLRGPQFHAAWADEFCAWRRPGELMAMLRMGLRLGEDPRMAVTTTPKPLPTLRRLMAEAGAVITRAATSDNEEHLSPGFLEGLHALYGGTRLAAQELEGQVLEADGAALFRMEALQACRGPAPAATFDRVVVAVDPPASDRGDACGIVVAARLGDRAWVLADRSVEKAAPLAWAGLAAEAARAHRADAIVAEANQGGDMVRTMLALAGADRPIVLVHATRSKRARAEPVAALYEQGRVTHASAFPRLEEELCALGAAEGPSRSPDRADALVWALTDLLLGPRAEPRLRVL